MKINKMAVAFGLVAMLAVTSAMAAGGFQSEAESVAKDIYDLGFGVFVIVAGVLIIITAVMIKWQGWAGLMYVFVACVIVGNIDSLMEMAGLSFPG